MKIAVCFLPLFAGLIVHVSASTLMRAESEQVNSEAERIVGGTDAEEGQFPWSAALYFDDQFICTCSIIGPTTVLTAAHCVVSNGVTGRNTSFHAIANVDKSSPEVRIEFQNVIPHPNYSESGIKNDIAILETTQPIPFSDTVRPVCIARSDTGPKEYRNVKAMGWGDTSRSRVVQEIPDILQWANQRVVSSLACKVAYFAPQLEDYKICAGDFNPIIFQTSGICNGDSGGPLVFGEGEDSIQIGIASYGNRIAGCGTIVPSVWTRVSSFNGFIKDNSKDTLCER